jgi:hypothetical protein
MKAVNDKLKEDMKNLSARVDDVVKCSEPEFKTNLKHLVREEVYDTNERAKKKCNVVIRGIEEVEDIEEDDERGIHGKTDEEIANHLFHEVVGARDVVVKEVTRVPSGITPGKPRLIVAKLENSDMKFKLLRKTRVLKDKAGWDRTYVAPDKTKREREEDKVLRDELQRRKDAGEKNWKINKGRFVPRTQPQEGAGARGGN